MDKSGVQRNAIAAAVFTVGAVLLASVPAHGQPASPTAAPTASTPAAKNAPSTTKSPATVSSKPGSGAKPPTTKGARKKRKGEVNPCMTPDPGWGVYDRWSRAVSMGQMIAPQRGGISRSGRFDLIVHFHGHAPIRKEFVKSAKGIVLVGIDLGIGSGAYSRAFASPVVFTKLLRSVEAEMAKRHGRKRATVRKLALSAWSAGYGAIAQILRQPAAKQVDALILLDSVHAGYADKTRKTLKTGSLQPFVKFARRSARGYRFMFQSYSSIIPPGYASTREVAHYVIGQLGAKPRKGRRNDVLGLKLFERYDRGGYHARGYRGRDKPDHCAHLGLMKDVVKVHLKRRWRSPRGYRAPGGSKKARGKKSNGLIYVVVRGDSLTAIAKRHGTTVAAIRDANGLKKGGRPILPGQELVIPKTKTAKKTGHTKSVRWSGKTHVVAKGDSLTAIAKRYGTTVRALRDVNGLVRGGRPIQPGQTLRIPKAKPSRKSRKKSKTRGKIHVVGDGQSLRGIAKRYHTTVEAIRRVNGMPHGSWRIRPGQKLVIPKGK